jgi:hypothetical protein
MMSIARWNVPFNADGQAQFKQRTGLSGLIWRKADDADETAGAAIPSIGVVTLDVAMSARAAATDLAHPGSLQAKARKGGQVCKAFVRVSSRKECVCLQLLALGGCGTGVEEAVAHFQAYFEVTHPDSRTQPSDDICGRVGKARQSRFEDARGKTAPAGMGHRDPARVPGCEEDWQTIRCQYGAGEAGTVDVHGIPAAHRRVEICVDHGRAMHLLEPLHAHPFGQLLLQALPVLLHCEGIVAHMQGQIETAIWRC